MSNLYRDQTLQKHVLRLIDAATHRGLTVAEIREAIPANHHGTLSGVLSVLHADMKIARLAEKREGCKIYVHPDYLDGRAAEAQGRGGMSKAEVTFFESLDGFLEYYLQVDVDGSRFGTDKTKAERNQRLFFQQLKALYAERP